MKRLLRCEFLVVVLFALSAIIISWVHVPYAERLIKQGKNLYGFWSLDNSTAQVKTRRKAVEQENKLLDSLITVYERNMKGDEGAAAAMLYERASAVGLRASRIEIGEKEQAGNHDETPVMVRGRGPYAAFGRFCETIENQQTPVRIRQIRTSGAGGNIEVAIDFALISEPQGRKKR
jgi:hypothetical protein